MDNFYLGVDADKLSQTVKVYTEIIGLEEQRNYPERRHPDGIVLLDEGYALFELYPLDPNQIYDDLGDLSISFVVDDVDDTYQQVAAMGIEMSTERTLIAAGSYRFEFHCPEGVEVSLFNRQSIYRFCFGVDADKLSQTVKVYADIIGMVEQPEYSERLHSDGVALRYENAHDGWTGLFELYPLAAHQAHTQPEKFNLLFAVDDVDALYERVAAMEIEIADELAKPQRYSFDFQCPDGVNIRFHGRRSMKPQRSS